MSVCNWCGLHGGEHEQDCGKTPITLEEYEGDRERRRGVGNLTEGEESEQT